MRIAFPRRPAAAVATIVLLAACGAAAPSTAPSARISLAPSAPAASAAAVLGRDWQKVAAVEAPASNGATPAPYENPGSLGHPMHYQGGQADIVDVVPYRAGFVAGGFLETATGPMAAAWSSPDGLRWALVGGFPTGDGTLVRAVAAGERGLVAVGADGPRAAAWHSADGRTWQRSSSAAMSVSGPAEVTTVLTTPTGFVAAGRAGGLGAETRATFWSSPDGIDWTQAPDGPDAAAARVEALAGGPGRWVAVGIAVNGTSITGGAVWTSMDGSTWRRAPSHEAAFGPIHGVTHGSDGFLAVGTNLAGTKAVVWRSPDGISWRAAPDADALDNYGLQIEMRDVAAVGDGYVAVGHLLFGTQFPSGVIWWSTDGVSWTRAPDAPMFQQARILAVVGSRASAVAVGTFGSPDFAIPTIWISPPRS